MEEELLLILELARDDSQKAFENAPPNMHMKEYMDYMGETNKALSIASRNYRMVKTPIFSEIPDYGDVMPLDEFIENCNSGGFIDYDGSGNYATDTQMSDIDIYPSDVKNNMVRKDFNKIVWFNR